MARKFYDIFPPGFEKQKRPVFVEKKQKKIKIPRKTNLRGLVVILLVLFLISSHTVFLKAEIIIHPQTEKVDYSGTIKADSSIMEIDYQQGLIPGQVFKMKEEGARTFSSSGKETEENKAQGTLRVYNNYSEKVQVLVANTRFISSDGKLFYSQERVTVPGQKQEGNRTVPGQITVSVMAAEAGEQYNIDKKVKFSIPGLQGTPMYSSIYAENVQAIAGGHLGELPKIMSEDLASAKEVLIQDILEKSKIKLEQEISDDYVIETNLAKYSITDEIVYPKVGENSEFFDYSVKVDIEMFSYKKKHLEQIVERFIQEKIKQEEAEQESFFGDKEINQKSLEISSTVRSIDSDKGLTTLDVKATADSYFSIQEDQLKKVLIGKKFKETTSFLKEYDEIEKSRFKRWPFWMSKIPDSKKFKVKIFLD
jgi:hypothetical protein